MMMRTELGGLQLGERCRKNFFLAFVEQETSQGRGGLGEFWVVFWAEEVEGVGWVFSGKKAVCHRARRRLL